MVTMAPPGLEKELVPEETLNSEGFKAKAVGEMRSLEAENRVLAESPIDPGILREPTQVGEPKVVERGLTYETLKPGDPEGEVARVGDTIQVRYTGMLEDGTVFDSTGDGEPAKFLLSVDQLIEGWVQGIPGMREGEVRKLIIPPELGYGELGSGDRIPPDATLTFEIELVEVAEEG